MAIIGQTVEMLAPVMPTGWVEADLFIVNRPNVASAAAGCEPTEVSARRTPDTLRKIVFVWQMSDSDKYSDAKAAPKVSVSSPAVLPQHDRSSSTPVAVDPLGGFN